MTAYVISRVSINDAQAMSDYIDRAPPGVTAHGGRYLVRTGDIDCLEGQTDYDRVVVLAFPDKEKALAWYNSSDYEPLREQRWKAADSHIIVVPGAD